jgi:acetyl-CoA C-acetyltransferase
MATGIKDKVAIIGMGCSKFGERWDCGTEHLMSEACQEALQDAGIEKSQIGAAWYGSALDRVNVGNSAIPATTALRLEGIPFTRVENMCATGTEALRGAAYAVAAGAGPWAQADRLSAPSRARVSFAGRTTSAPSPGRAGPAAMW